jgi:hypothetical protein
MLTSLLLASMLAAGPTPDTPAPAAPPPQTYSDLSRLPLGILHDLPLPANFDLDGDGQPDPVVIDSSDHGNLVVAVTSTKTGKRQTLVQTKASLIELGATDVGMALEGDPKAGVTVSLHGLKGDEELLPITVEVKPRTLVVTAEGKRRAFTWNGASFVAE